MVYISRFVYLSNSFEQIEIFNYKKIETILKLYIGQVLLFQNN